MKRAARLKNYTEAIAPWQALPQEQPIGLGSYWTLTHLLRQQGLGSQQQGLGSQQQGLGSQQQGGCGGQGGIGGRLQQQQQG